MSLESFRFNIEPMETKTSELHRHDNRIDELIDTFSRLSVKKRNIHRPITPKTMKLNIQPNIITE